MAESPSQASGAEAEDHVLFMCQSCKAPIGDSGDQQDDNKEENLILLSGVTNNVEINTVREVSPYELDSYSAVHSLFCKGCSAGIGVLYAATPRQLDYKRGLFSLNKRAMTCYSFNNTTKQRVPQEQANHPTVSYMDTQLKKCRTVLGDCTRSLSKLEHHVNELSVNSH
ncbi:protein Mis18-alpha-like isoform X2 [Ranitomeya variabilis]|uniref:protein Mis18-alpha-like isoform X2 n=1 Tax=Ranitomeya variabilis TaxID=490064 RepID=UPI0040577177